MAVAKLDSKVVTGSLVFILKRLAVALDWARQKGGKISLDVQGEVLRAADGPKAIGASCPRICGPDDRIDIEILMAVFKAMEEDGQPGFKAMARQQARRGK